MTSLMDVVPDAETLLGLEPEDLGAILVEIIQKGRSRNVAISNIETPLWNANSPKYPIGRKSDVARAFAEAWQWLQNEGLLMPDPEQPNGYWVLTRRGRKLKTGAAVTAYLQGNLLPLGALDPALAEKVRPMFLRGDYEVAVFQAYKQVEVAVRTAANERGANLPDDLVGVKLMRRAFDADSGPLRDQSAPSAEREALAHLFAGAIGHAKNPTSHREVTIGRRGTAQLIAFASYLLDAVTLHSML
jgi:uncharacterized protein (TIGR02391 family)